MASTTPAAAENNGSAIRPFRVNVPDADLADLISAAAQKTDEISVPVAITVFPDEVLRAQERWARGAFRNLIYFRHTLLNPA